MSSIDVGPPSISTGNNNSSSINHEQETLSVTTTEKSDSQPTESPNTSLDEPLSLPPSLSTSQQQDAHSASASIAANLSSTNATSWSSLDGIPRSAWQTSPSDGILHSTAPFLQSTTSHSIDHKRTSSVSGTSTFQNAASGHLPQSVDASTTLAGQTGINGMNMQGRSSTVPPPPQQQQQQQGYQTAAVGGLTPAQQQLLQQHLLQKGILSSNTITQNQVPYAGMDARSMANLHAAAQAASYRQQHQQSQQQQQQQSVYHQPSIQNAQQARLLQQALLMNGVNPNALQQQGNVHSAALLNALINQSSQSHPRQPQNTGSTTVPGSTVSDSMNAALVASILQGRQTPPATNTSSAAQSQHHNILSQGYSTNGGLSAHTQQQLQWNASLGAGPNGGQHQRPVSMTQLQSDALIAMQRQGSIGHLRHFPNGHSRLIPEQQQLAAMAQLGLLNSGPGQPAAGIGRSGSQQQQQHAALIAALQQQGVGIKAAPPPSLQEQQQQHLLQQYASSQHSVNAGVRLPANHVAAATQRQQQSLLAAALAQQGQQQQMRLPNGALGGTLHAGYHQGSAARHAASPFNPPSAPFPAAPTNNAPTNNAQHTVTPADPIQTLQDIGKTLSQLNISVEAAVNAGLLGGLSAADVRIVTEAHSAAEAEKKVLATTTDGARPKEGVSLLSAQQQAQFQGRSAHQIQPLGNANPLAPWRDAASTAATGMSSAPNPSSPTESIGAVSIASAPAPFVPGSISQGLSAPTSTVDEDEVDRLLLEIDEESGTGVKRMSATDEAALRARVQDTSAEFDATRYSFFGSLSGGSSTPLGLVDDPATSSNSLDPLVYENGSGVAAAVGAPRASTSWPSPLIHPEDFQTKLTLKNDEQDGDRPTSTRSSDAAAADSHGVSSTHYGVNEKRKESLSSLWSSGPETSSQGIGDPFGTHLAGLRLGTGFL